MKRELQSIGLLFLSFLISEVVTAQGYNFVGNSFSTGDDCYVLTPGSTWQNGAIWYNQAIDLNEPFSLQYVANFGNNDGGADGMFFVIQQVGNNILGEAGGGIGFSGFQPSLGIEFDTHQNFENVDPGYDHLSILRNGNVNHGTPDNLAGPVPISFSSVDVEDGEDYIIEIEWNPDNNGLTISVNCTPRISTNIDLLNQVFTESPMVFWGFTGATGGFFNEQTICIDPYIPGLPESFETCPGSPIQLEAPAATFGTFSWEPAQFLDDPTSNSPVANVSETTEFTLTYEDLCGELQIETTTLIVNEPSLDLGPDLLACGEQNVSLNAQGNFDEITWSDGSIDTELVVNQSGTYWATAFLGGCGEATDTVDVEIAPSPSYDSALEVEFCEGETYTFTANPDYDILWYDGDDSSERTFDEPGNYDFDLSLGECEESFTLDLTIQPLPQMELGPDISLCGEESVALSAQGNFDEVIWSTGSTELEIAVFESGQYWAESFLNNCSTSDTVEVALLEAPEYSQPTQVDLCEGEQYFFQLNQPQTQITWFDGAIDQERTFSESGIYDFELVLGECSEEFSLDLTFFPIPEFDLGPDVAICFGESFNLEVDLTSAEVIWNNGSQGQIINLTQGGIYSATATENQCTFTDSVEVEVLDTPELTVEGTDKLCPGETGKLTAISNYEISWSTGDTGYDLTIDESGYYSATTVNEAGCSTSEAVLVSGLNLPSILLDDRGKKCRGQSFSIRASSSRDQDLIWSNGQRGPVLTVDSGGVFSVELSNECGVAREELFLEEENCFNQAFVPNAFTPDGDGLNDLFKVEVGTNIGIELMIFDRSGKMVFQTNDPHSGWNGSFQNNQYFCPAGLYSYRLLIDYSSTEQELYQGSLLLIR